MPQIIAKDIPKISLCLVPISSQAPVSIQLPLSSCRHPEGPLQIKALGQVLECWDRSLSLYTLQVSPATEEMSFLLPTAALILGTVGFMAGKLFP